MIEKNRIDISDMLYLAIIVEAEYRIRGLNSPYSNLYDQIETYKLSNTKFDINIHNIDDFLVDVYMVYDKIIVNKDKILEFSKNNFNIFSNFLDPEVFLNEFKKFKKIFENIILLCDFTDSSSQIRGIQKNILLDIQNRFIEEEEYEQAAYVRDKIKSIR